MNIALFPRTGFAAVAVLCLALLGYAYYSQYGLGYEPCPLCILQRVAFMIMAVGALAGAVHGSRSWARFVWGAIVLAGGLWGLATAGRHVWLQNLPPDQVPDCGPGLGYMLEYFSVGEALVSAFTGSGECAEVDWSFLGLSMPAWTLVWYVALMILTVLALRRGPSESNDE
ncbi:MAG: disulfide bond formation protein B [Wenzhouxiangellaceae bacterium]|nr:disulfide bond formation protein B [Wenzhouxiangellaceae bacterium]